MVLSSMLDGLEQHAGGGGGLVSHAEAGPGAANVNSLPKVLVPGLANAGFSSVSLRHHKSE